MAEDAMSANTEARKAILRKISLVNVDLRERMHAEGMEIEYSSEDDYLRVTIGKPRASESITSESALYSVILFDPETYSINALEAPFFLENVRKIAPKDDFWLLVADLVTRGGPTIYIPPAEAGERAEKAFGRLLVG